MICPQPFEQVEIHEDGSVYTCCPWYINFYNIGNIFDEPFDKIWNSEKAINFRRKILNGDFSNCTDYCYKKTETYANNENYKEIMGKFPRIVWISTDYACNVKCKFCRDENIVTKYSVKNLENEINDKYIPIFKDAEIVEFGVNGEPFASIKEKVLMKKIAEVYPNIKFTIHTNGILGNEKMLKELGIYNRLEKICVSFHSTSFWTYRKIVKNGSFRKVMSNLKLYSELKKKKLLSKIDINMCVYSENYKEMPAFVKMAEKYDAYAYFWGVKNSNSSQVCRNYEKYDVLNPRHKDFFKLLEILKNPIFDSPHSALSPEIEKYRIKD